MTTSVTGFVEDLTNAKETQTREENFVQNSKEPFMDYFLRSSQLS